MTPPTAATVTPTVRVEDRDTPGMMSPRTQLVCPSCDSTDVVMVDWAVREFHEDGIGEAAQHITFNLGAEPHWEEEKLRCDSCQTGLELPAGWTYELAF